MLGTPDRIAAELSRGRPAPADVADIVCRAFESCLGLESVDLDVDFLAAGGTLTEAEGITKYLARELDAHLDPALVLRCPTPRTVAAAVDSILARRVRMDSDTVVPLGAGTGLPIFFIHGVTPRPWMYRAVLPALELTRPVLGTRAPDLAWERDVLTIEEMVEHYASEIRRVQERGPYSLIGYSFGGTLAFAIAARLMRDGAMVRHLILLDTSAPRARWAPYRPNATHLLLGVLRTLSRRRMIGHALLRRVNLRSAIGNPSSCLGRVRLAFGTGPLTIDELRTALRTGFRQKRKWEVDRMSFHELCETLSEELRECLTIREWQRLVRRAAAESSVSLIKGQKVTVKNIQLAQQFTPPRRYRGRVTIYAREGNGSVKGWQRFTCQPLDVREVRVRVEKGRDQHRAFIEPDVLSLYAEDLRNLLEAEVPVGGREVKQPDRRASSPGPAVPQMASEADGA